MGSRTTYPTGQFCWVDLMSHDYDAAASFYGEVFGWTCEVQDTHGGPRYGIFHLGDQQVGGIGQMSDEMKSQGMPSFWSVYCKVDDVDAATKKAVAAGGTVMMEPIPVLESGRMSIVVDPGGAALSLWQPINHHGSQIVNEPNTWIWNDLMTSDPEGSVKFYEAMFGWTMIESPMDNGSEYWEFKNQGHLIGGMMRRSDDDNAPPPHWSTYFSVTDLNATVTAIESRGGHVVVPSFNTEVGDICVVSDPFQGVFDLVQLTVPADE